jgi:hypothetical protein
MKYFFLLVIVFSLFACNGQKGENVEIQDQIDFYEVKGDIEMKYGKPLNIRINSEGNSVFYYTDFSIEVVCFEDNSYKLIKSVL